MSDKENADINIEELSEQSEEEYGNKRRLVGVFAMIANVIGCAFGIFQFITGGYRPMSGIIQSTVHVGLTLVLIFFYYPATKKSKKHVTIMDILCVLASIVCVVYVISYSDKIIALTVKNNNWQIIFGAIIIILILEASRRSLGIIFPILVGVFLIYAFLGHFIPGTFGHKFFRPSVIIRNIYFDAQGLWGHLLQMSSTLLALFLTFGAVLLKSGGGEAFLDISYMISARARGGPAKIATIMSALFGMISGSSTANAATTGTFTIPLMKKNGFSPEFAAATEGSASTGGMLMPPIMGAGAFLMAQFLGMSYSKIAFAAIVPALLYYFSIFFSVHFEAIRKRMKPVGNSEFEEYKKRFSIKKSVIPMIPIVVLILFFVLGYTVQLAAFISSLLSLVLMLFTIDMPWGSKRFIEFLKRLFGAFSGAGLAIAQVAVLLASAQIMVSILGLTGLAIKFSNLIVSVGQANILATLALSMVLLFFLGMGVPVTAVYVIGASIVAPALIKLGLASLPVHLFTFYFSCLGAITPPVCGVIFITAALAKANWWKSGWLSVRMVLPGFIVPYLIIFKPTLLFIGAPVEIVLDVTTAFIGVVLIASGGVGYFFDYCKIYERLALIIAGLFLVLPHMTFALVGIVLAVFVVVLQLIRKKNNPRIEGLGQV
jgi:TRAP transporter 4TM/12TM fusion protein